MVDVIGFGEALGKVKFRTPYTRQTTTSYLEQFLYHSIAKVYGYGDVRSRDRDAVGMELDVYVVSRAYAIEIGALCWHFNRLERDQMKVETCRANGIRLRTIYTGVPRARSLDYPWAWTYSEHELSQIQDIGQFKGLVQRVVDDIERVPSKVNLTSLDWIDVARRAELSARGVIPNRLWSDDSGNAERLYEYADALISLDAE